jgi:hypothetical protein
VRLGGEELPPGRPGPPRRGIDVGGVQDLPHRGRGDRVPQPGQLPLDPPMAPSREMLSSTFSGLCGAGDYVNAR